MPAKDHLSLSQKEKLPSSEGAEVATVLRSPKGLASRPALRAGNIAPFVGGRKCWGLPSIFHSPVGLKHGGGETPSPLLIYEREAGRGFLAICNRAVEEEIKTLFNY